ncbi:hypothetical protein PVAG01_09867 [Phlyctema vagabunda]|uniref:Heterokaryon incompatibility domain-containing protein n=1 Tax=Phlyctema vagabunda TaxID=108571 RepID=A0ABR4P4H2_9HELO
MSDPEDLGRYSPQQRLPRSRTGFDPQEGNDAGTTRQRLANAVNQIINREQKDSYAYRTIDYQKEIRVLRLYPGAPGSPILCCLVHRPLLDQLPREISNKNESINYTALSYYWGDEKPKHKIGIFATHNDYEKWKDKPDFIRHYVGHKRIRNNLRDALEQLRSMTDNVYLWADALCINQENLKERTVQVARMHNVFMHAEKVCIWLGKGIPEENEKTFDFLRKILDLEKLEEVAKRLMDKDKDVIWENDRQDCKRFIDLMKVEWFSRRWVIQELLLATNAHVRRGHHEMPWLDFADATALFMTKYDNIRRAFGSPGSYSGFRTSDSHYISSLDARVLGANTLVTATSRLFRKSDEGRILHRLLSLEVLVSSMLIAFEARDPRDTVFAVLQIAKDVPSNGQITISKKNRAQMLIWYLAPLFFVIFWNAVAYQFLPVTTNKGPTSESHIRKSLATLIWYCMKALGMLLSWLVCRMLLNMIDSWIARHHSPQSLDERIKPDYRKCFRDVCADFIEYCIENSNSLDILCRHWVPSTDSSVDSGIEVMPSWILSITGHAFGGPEQAWRRRVNGDSFVGEFETRTQYAASGTLRPDFEFGKMKIIQKTAVEERDQDPDEYKVPLQDKTKLPPRFDGTLKVKGFLLGTIEQTERIAGEVITKEALEICGWSKRTKTANLDQVWRILVADRGPNGTNPPTWYRRACEACLEWYAMKSGEDVFNTSTLKNLPGTPAAKIAFLERVQQVTWNRRIIRTDKQNAQAYIGVAPQESERSDIVCILYGCSVPVVLRPLGNFEYRFLGGCYIHGVMDGEAVESAPRGRHFKLV